MGPEASCSKSAALQDNCGAHGMQHTAVFPFPACPFLTCCVTGLDVNALLKYGALSADIVAEEAIDLVGCDACVCVCVCLFEHGEWG